MKAWLSQKLKLKTAQRPNPLIFSLGDSIIKEIFQRHLKWQDKKWKVRLLNLRRTTTLDGSISRTETMSNQSNIWRKLLKANLSLALLSPEKLLKVLIRCDDHTAYEKTTRITSTHHSRKPEC